MARNVFGILGSHAAVETGTPVDVSHLEDVSILIGGTFVGTVNIEVSMDGTNWVALTGALGGATAPVVALVGLPVKEIRTDVTAYTSGAIEVLFAGVDR